MGDLAVHWITLKDLPAPVEPAQETGDTFAANAIEKASHYSRASGDLEGSPPLWTLADDSGLLVDALGGEPGVHSARYAGLDCDVSGRERADAANNARLIRELTDVPESQRTARFRCALALVEGGCVLAETSGVVEGRILRSPRGSNGFGYDPLFFIDAMGCTTAELAEEQKNAISHRGQAVRAMHPLLEGLLKA
jgi:XTP/dITP diphosphohydrolase